LEIRGLWPRYGLSRPSERPLAKISGSVWMANLEGSRSPHIAIAVVLAVYCRRREPFFTALVVCYAVHVRQAQPKTRCAHQSGQDASFLVLEPTACRKESGRGRALARLLQGTTCWGRTRKIAKTVNRELFCPRRVLLLAAENS
jgi:hypothetical protein